MVGYLFRRFIEANGLSCKVNGSDAAVRLWEDNSFIQSDISVCCDDSIIDDGWFLRVPEIVVEVLSKSTKAYCQGEKLEIYREFGAKEYWMVDIENRTVRVEYFVDGSASVYKPGDVIHSKFFDGLAILADDVFKNM
jgi:Uma2 family endonuclease